MIPDYHGYSVVSVVHGSPTGEVFTVLPVGDVRIRVIPYIPSKTRVIELIDGTRVAASHDKTFHIDVEIDWEEIGDVKWPALVAWVRNAFANPTLPTKFYPVANASLTGPHGDFPGIEVVPDFDDNLIKIVYEDRVRQRSANLVLKGKSPIAEASLPSWAAE